MKKLVIVGLLSTSVLVSGCQTITRGANYLGSYMPVIGERCESTECFTSEGQAESDAIKARRAAEQGMMEDGKAAGEDDDAETTAGEETTQPIIPPSTESGIPEVEQRSARKPFPKTQ